MVNKGDGQGRRAENVVEPRALFTDDDGGGPTPKPPTDVAPPTMVVQSKRGPQEYWVLQPGEPKEAFTGAQAALAQHFGTDPKVKDLPRVMRVPGFFHMKDRGQPFLVTVKEVRNFRYTIQQVLTAFPSAVKAANEPMGSTESKKTRPSTKRSSTSDTSIAIRRARAYLSQVPGAVQGKHYLGARPSKKAMEKVRQRVSEIVWRGRTECWKDICRELNQYLTGWAAYFAYDTAYPSFRLVDIHVAARTRNFLRRRHKLPTGTARFGYVEVHRDLGVVELRSLPASNAVE